MGSNPVLALRPSQSSIGLLVVLLVSLSFGASAFAEARPNPQQLGPRLGMRAVRISSDTELQELIRRGFEHNYHGDYVAADRVWSELATLHPKHPAAAVHRIDTLFWRLSYDETSPRYDEEIVRLAKEALALTRPRLERDPKDAEAHFYKGQALIHLARLDVMRDHLLAAGSKGEMGRESLERALELDPGRADIKFPLGLYYYYAARLPSVARMMSWLWFVPKGDGPTGLRYLETAAQPGGLFSTASALTLAGIHHDFENQPERALATIDELRARYPNNVLFAFYSTSILLELEQFDRAIASALLLEAREGLTSHELQIQNQTRVWRARAELEAGSEARAWAILAPIEPADVLLPSWGLSWLHVLRGNVMDLKGQRKRAIAEYEATLALKPPELSRSALARAKDGMKRAYEVRRGSSRSVTQ